MPEKIAPLSATVSAIFVGFVAKIEADKILNAPAAGALDAALKEQKLDPASLRTAIFMPIKLHNDPD